LAKTKNKPVVKVSAKKTAAEAEPLDVTADTLEPGGPVGAVMVVGGGIGGIQASLDLVEMGYRVYLVDSGPSIGGVMGQLDKTFPTRSAPTRT